MSGSRPRSKMTKLSADSRASKKAMNSSGSMVVFCNKQNATSEGRPIEIPVPRRQLVFGGRPPNIRSGLTTSSKSCAGNSVKARLTRMSALSMNICMGLRARTTRVQRRISFNVDKMSSSIQCTPTLLYSLYFAAISSVLPRV